MKIYSSRRDDVRQRRAEYAEKKRPYAEREEELSKAYRNADEANRKKIEDAVLAAIGDTSLNIDVLVNTSFISRGLKYTVTVQANEHNKFDNNVALAWHIDIELADDGEVLKDSSSWSGLKAVTPEQIADLKESVRVIERVNDIDWPAILSTTPPNYADYTDKENFDTLHQLEKDEPNWRNEEIHAMLEDAMESNEWLEMEGRPETDYYRGSNRGQYFVKVEKLTPKFAQVAITRDLDRPDIATQERIAIDKLGRYLKLD